MPLAAQCVCRILQFVAMALPDRALSLKVLLSNFVLLLISGWFRFVVDRSSRTRENQDSQQAGNCHRSSLFAHLKELHLRRRMHILLSPKDWQDQDAVLIY